MDTVFDVYVYSQKCFRNFRVEEPMDEQFEGDNGIQQTQPGEASVTGTAPSTEGEDSILPTP